MLRTRSSLKATILHCFWNAWHLFSRPLRNLTIRKGTRSLCSHILHFRDGDHVCFPYDNESEQMKAVVEWIHAGLRHEEKCRYFADDNSVAEVMHHLETAGLNVHRECKRGALAFAVDTGARGPPPLLPHVARLHIIRRPSTRGPHGRAP